MGRERKILPENADKHENSLQEACVLLRSQKCLPPGEQITMAEAARRFNVRYDTLRRRYQGLNKSSRKGHESQQCLSHVEEQVLLECIINLSKQSGPVSKQSLREMVEQITGGRVKCGKNWIARFLLRHPSIKLGKSASLDPNPPTINMDDAPAMPHVSTPAGETVKTVQPLRILSPAPALGDSHRTPTPSTLPTDASLGCNEQLEATLDAVERLEREITELRKNLDLSTTHCSLAMTQIGHLKERLNGKEVSKARSKTVALNTHGVGPAQFNAVITEKNATKRKKRAERSSTHASEGPSLVNGENSSPTVQTPASTSVASLSSYQPTHMLIHPAPVEPGPSTFPPLASQFPGMSLYNYYHAIPGHFQPYAHHAPLLFLPNQTSPFYPPDPRYLGFPR